MYTLFTIWIFLKIFKACPNIATTSVPLHIVINYMLSHIQSTIINPVLKMGRLRLISATGAKQGSAISKWYNWYSGPTRSCVCRDKRELFMIDYEAHASFGLGRDTHFNFIFPFS